MTERALVEYIVNALWQVPLIAGAGWLLLRMLWPSPRLQHVVWLAVLVLAVLLPMHGMGRAGVPALQPQSTAAIARERTASPELSFTRGPHLVPRIRVLTLNATAVRWLVRLYLATVVFALLRIMRAWRGARGLVVHSRETSSHNVVLAHYSRRFGVKLPQVRESGEVSSPMIVGVVAPVLLLPEGFDRFTVDEVRAALCHELAHIKRQDYLVNLLCRIAALPLAWHPVVDEVQQRIRMTREMVCDAMAAQEMKSHIDYAKCLLALAHGMVGGRRLAGQAEFLGLFSNNTLEERVMRLTETTRMSLRARVARAAGGAAGMLAAGVIAAMFHVTPTMAALKADAPPQAGETAVPQTQPLVTRSESSASSTSPKQTPRGHTAREKRTIRQSEDAQRKMSEAAIMLNSPEFKQQMEDAQRRAAKAAEMLDTPEFKQQMEDAQRQMAKANAIIDAPEFKQRMDEAQRQMAKASAIFNSPEFKQKMENAQRQMDAAKMILDNPEFKQKMEDAQRQASKAAEMFNTPQFKQQMDDLRKLQSDSLMRQMEEDTERRQTPPAQNEDTPAK